MTVWKNSTMDTYYGSESAKFNQACEVKIDGKDISISYDIDGRTTLYSGMDHGNGHFELGSDAIKSKATLHRFNESMFLDGWWTEEGNVGMWRITLED